MRFSTAIGICTVLEACAHGQMLCAAEVPPFRLVEMEDSVIDNCKMIDVAILREALTNRLGITVICETMPWARAQRMVEDNHRDAMITTKTEERAAYTHASSVPAVQLHTAMFTSAHHPAFNELNKIRSLTELQPYRVMTYIGDGWAKGHLVSLGIHIDWSLDVNSVLHKLVLGRGDVFLQPDIYTLAQIKAQHLEKEITELPTDFGPLNYYLLIGKKSIYADKMPAIDAALLAMQKDGTYARLYKSFL